MRKKLLGKELSEFLMKFRVTGKACQISLVSWGGLPYRNYRLIWPGKIIVQRYWYSEVVKCRGPVLTPPSRVIQTPEISSITFRAVPFFRRRGVRPKKFVWFSNGGLPVDQTMIVSIEI
jgi:hypothetical protein